MTRPEHPERSRASRDIEMAEALIAVMDTPKGRRFVWGVLEMSGLYGPLMTGNSHTFHLIGARDLGVRLLGLIKEFALEQSRLMEDEELARQRRVAFDREQAEKAKQDNEDPFKEDAT